MRNHSLRIPRTGPGQREGERVKIEERAVLNCVYEQPTRHTEWKVPAPSRTLDVAPLDTIFPWELWPHAYFELYPGADGG